MDSQPTPNEEPMAYDDGYVFDNSGLDHQTKSLLVGAVVGAMLGVIFAWVVNDAEADGETGLETLGPSDYFQLGISVLTLARQFGNMLK